MKRVFDIIVSIIALVVLSPLFLFIGISVKLSSSDPIFYRAIRVGQYGTNFHLFKFRSMVVDADVSGAKVTRANDSRITPIGKFLRNTKIDELPQLVNVLRGEMSIVGPRPEDPYYVAMYDDVQRKVLNVRPGITSLASLKYRYEEKMLVGDNWEQKYIEIIMPAKLEIDLEYVKNPSLIGDMIIISQTVFSLIFSRG